MGIEAVTFRERLANTSGFQNLELKRGIDAKKAFSAIANSVVKCETDESIKSTKHKQC